MSQIKSFWLLDISLFVLFCCLAVPVRAESTNNTNNNGYPEGFGKLLMDNCVKTGDAKGAPADLVESQCSCFVNRLQAEITFESMAAMANESHRTGKSAPAIEAISQSCRNHK
jgi:hypothetical protein